MHLISIETEVEYQQALAVAEKLTFTPQRTPKQTALHKLLVMLIETYEQEHYSIAQSSPHLFKIALKTKEPDRDLLFWVAMPGFSG